MAVSLSDAATASLMPQPSPDRARLASRRVVAMLLVVLLGGAATAAAGAYFVSRPGVYWTRVQVLFLAPLSVRYPNSLSVSSDSLIDAAGVVAIEVGSSVKVSAVSDAVTIVGEGIRHGYQVRLPDSGGQWSTNFDKPLLDVQVAGTSPSEVGRTLATVLHEIDSDLASLQQQAQVDKVDLIRTSQNPATPPLYYQGGSRSRAALATLVIGVSLTAAAAGWVGRRRVGQRHAPRVS